MQKREWSRRDGASAHRRWWVALAVLAVLTARPAGADLLTDARYQVGAKSRLAQFIRRGADPKEAEAIFHRLSDLEPRRWVAEWTRLAEPWEQAWPVVFLASAAASYITGAIIPVNGGRLMR